jgi:tetratricopeptide (TPR) repeat protein
MPDTPVQLRIFVSHSHRDNDACRAVVNALRGAGADVWYDEHNLGAGQLLEEIQREVHARPIFILLLSKNAFAAPWVKRETTWAFNLYNREPLRVILPITVGPIEASDFNAWLFLEDFKRVEAPGMQPHTLEEAIHQTLKLLALTAQGEEPVAVTPQPGESFDDLLTQGKALWAQQKYLEALPYLERATNMAPGSSDAWFNLGATLGALDRYDESLRASERAIALDPLAFNAWTNKGTALDRLGRRDEALAAYEKATEIAPTEPAVWVNKGNMLG